MRRIVGATLTAAGAGVLLFVGWTAASGGLARDRARAAWAAEEARLTGEAARIRVAGKSEGPQLRGAPVGRLWIPSIELDEVVVEGVGDDELKAGPGHLPGSVLPGERGNAIISAHRDLHFRDLDEVAIGDTVVTQTRHQRALWRVIDRKVVGASAPALRSAREPRLTLTTCWPVRYFGPAPDRLLITAVVLPEGQSASD